MGTGKLASGTTKTKGYILITYQGISLWDAGCIAGRILLEENSNSRSQQTELPSNVVLACRVTQASAAFAIAGCQLPERNIHRTPAIAKAMPNSTNVFFRCSCRCYSNQQPEAHSGDVSLSGLDGRAASAVLYSSSLQTTGIQKNFIPAITAAFPNNISVLSLRSRRNDFQLSNAKTDFY